MDKSSVKDKRLQTPPPRRETQVRSRPAPDAKPPGVRKVNRKPKQSGEDSG